MVTFGFNNPMLSLSKNDSLAKLKQKKKNKWDCPGKNLADGHPR